MNSTVMRIPTPEEVKELLSKDSTEYTDFMRVLVELMTDQSMMTTAEDIPGRYVFSIHQIRLTQIDQEKVKASLKEAGWDVITMTKVPEGFKMVIDTPSQHRKVS